MGKKTISVWQRDGTLDANVALIFTALGGRVCRPNVGTTTRHGRPPFAHAGVPTDIHRHRKFCRKIRTKSSLWRMSRSLQVSCFEARRRQGSRSGKNRIGANPCDVPCHDEKSEFEGFSHHSVCQKSVNSNSSQILCKIVPIGLSLSRQHTPQNFQIFVRVGTRNSTSTQ